MTATTRLASLLAVAAATAAAGPVHAQELTVPIGHTGPLSGANAFAGKDNENGMRLAIEDLNARQLKAGGRTLKFVLRSEDDQCDAKTGVAVAQKFVDDNVKFVVGPYCSGVAIPASRVYSDGGTLMSTVGTNPKITAAGYTNVFRIIASDAQIGASIPSFNVFDKEGGGAAARTYAAYNPSADPITVAFTDGFTMEVPGHTQMSKQGPIKAIALRPFARARGRALPALWNAAAYPGRYPGPVPALVIGGVMLVTAGAPAFIGYKKVPTKPLDRTRRRLETDVQVIKEGVT